MVDSPTKNVIKGIAIFLLILGGWFFLFYIKNKRNEPLVYTQENGARAIKDSRTKENLLSKDADADGLKDWEEILFGTDPENPDTDGDGTGDAEEIRAKRDPVKPGPDDALSENSTIKPFQNEETTSTNKLVFDIVSGLSGQSTTTEFNINEVIDARLIETIKKSPPLQDRYGAKDITTTPDSPDSIRAYANGVGNVFKNEFTQFDKGELLVLREIAKSKNVAELKIFKEYEKAYRGAIDILITLPAPSSYAPFHLALLNNFNNLADINSVFAVFKENPVNSILYLNHYNRELERFAAFTKDIAAKFENDNIVFLEEEPGALLIEYAEQIK